MVILKGRNERIAKIWVDDLAQIDLVTIKQIKLMLELPFLFRHLAIMPDAHLGKGAVVGGVVATQNIVVPNIVGVDIGCGVSSFCTGISYEPDKMGKQFWLDWKTKVFRLTPTGFDVHSQPQDLGPLNTFLKASPLKHFIPDKAVYQMQTLGGGNHFIEAQVDENNIIWLMVHSGSRHTGLQIANYYSNLARELNQQFHDQTPKDLWFLRLEEDFGQDYLHDMTWAVGFALENRWRILEVMVKAFQTSYQNFYGATPPLTPVRDTGINIHHNFANLETHFGEEVVIHRKGATWAKTDQIGIIPGSMGTPSFIVRGLGNPASYMSCAHGAGRRMSRSEAKRKISQKDFAESLKNTFTKASSRIIDEAPKAYKDIDEVMKNQADLVKIIHKLTPIITIKGEEN